MCKSKVKIEVGKSYKGLINGCIFKVAKVAKMNPLYRGKYYVIEFKKQPEEEWRRTYSESLLEHLQITPID